MLSTDRWSLAPPFHPSPALPKQSSAGLFSVALTVGSPRAAVSRQWVHLKPGSSSQRVRAARPAGLLSLIMRRQPCKRTAHMAERMARESNPLGCRPPRFRRGRSPFAPPSIEHCRCRIEDGLTTRTAAKPFHGVENAFYQWIAPPGGIEPPNPFTGNLRD